MKAPNSQVKIFTCAQSYNKDFQVFEDMVNDWIEQMEDAGGTLVDVRVQVNGEDRFTSILMTITILYLMPPSWAAEKQLRKERTEQ